MTRRHVVRLAGLALIAVLVAGCGGAGSKSYDVGATHDCLTKSLDNVGLDWYPGKPDARHRRHRSCSSTVAVERASRFYGSLPYYGTNVGRATSSAWRSSRALEP